MHDWQEPPDLRRTLKRYGVKQMDIAKSAHVHLTTVQDWTKDPMKMRIGAAVTCAKVAKTSAVKLIPILGRDYGQGAAWESQTLPAQEPTGTVSRPPHAHEPYFISAPGFRGEVDCLYNALQIVAALQSGTVYQRVWQYDAAISDMEVLARMPCQCTNCERLAR